MAYYHLFWDPEKEQPHVIKTGFNFLAFFFTFFYFLFYRCWISAGAFLAANVALQILITVLQVPEVPAFLIMLIYQIYIGLDAADCMYGEYHKKGFKYLKSGFYKSKEHAVANVFELK